MTTLEGVRPAPSPSIGAGDHPDVDDRRGEQRGQAEADYPTRPPAFEISAQEVAAAGPQGRAGDDDDEHRGRDEDAADDDWQVGRPERRHRSQGEDPGLRVDDLEGHGLDQRERTGDGASFESTGSGDLIGEV